MPVAIPDAVLQIDGGILLFIQNNMRSPALTPVFKGISDYGTIVMCVYLAIMLLWDKRKLFPIASACVVSGLIGTYMKIWLKKTVMRPRPFLEISGLEPLFKRRQGTRCWHFPLPLSPIASCRKNTAFLPSASLRW